jgi:putative phage-type endonuclease
VSALAIPVRQRTPEWVAWRREHITSSDAVVLAGERGSVVQLWAEKRGLVESTFDDETEDLMEIGQALEPALRSLYASRMSRPIRARHIGIESREWPVAAASLDAESGRRIVETKWSHSVEWFRAVAAGSPDPVPGRVMAQVQWQMFVARREVADVAILLGREFKVIEVGRDDAYIGNLQKMARWFWPFVERGEQPPVDGLDGTTRALRDLYPQDNGEWLPATPELVDLVRRYAAAKAVTKDVETVEKTLGNEIRALLGERSGITGLVSNKANASTEVTETNWEAVARAFRALALQFTVVPREEAEEKLDVIESIHTRTYTKPGPRQLRLLKGATS